MTASHTPRDRFRVVCTGLLVERGRILFVRETKQIARGLYNLPAGRLEPNETVHDGVRREVREETGLHVRLIRLIGVYERVRSRQGQHLINFVFLVKRTSGKIRPSKEHPEVRFFSLAEIADLKRQGLLRTPTILAALRDWQKGQAAPTTFLKPIWH